MLSHPEAGCDFLQQREQQENTAPVQPCRDARQEPRNRGEERIEVFGRKCASRMCEA